MYQAYLCTMVDFIPRCSIGEKKIGRDPSVSRNMWRKAWKFWTKHWWDEIPGVKERGWRLGLVSEKPHESLMQTADGLRGREWFYRS